MSVFSVPIEISDLERRRSERIDAWVDTGAFYSSAPRPLLETLGVVPHEREAFMLADGRTVENDIGYVWIRVGAKSTITVVIFAEPGSQPLLGAYTLEGLALAADVRNQRLVQMPWLLLGELLLGLGAIDQSTRDARGVAAHRRVEVTNRRK